MRAFQALCVVAAAVACRGQFATYRSSGYSIASAPAAIHTSYAPSVISAAPALLTRTVAAPALLTRTVAVHSPAAVTTVAAAPVAIASAAPATAVNVGVVAAAPAGGIRTHEIHTGSGRQAIRIEDYQAGDQVIRIQEAPQAGPQIAQVRVPGEQHHVRVINHQSGPAQVQRLVHRQQTQVFNVQKPGRPGARIVQVVKAESPAPSVEFINAGGSNHHVYHANDAGYGLAGASNVAYHSGHTAVHTVAAAPTVAVHSNPIVHSVAAAPVTTSIVSAPSTFVTGHSYGHVAAPVATSIVSAPSTYVTGHSYGHAAQNTVVLHKKA